MYNQLSLHLIQNDLQKLYNQPDVKGADSFEKRFL